MAIPFRERISCSIPEAVEATGIGRTRIYEAIGQGRLKSTTHGKRRLVSVPSLIELVESQQAS
jgi:predicted DNA-binding transcriptional regulator AlpA